MMDNAIYYIVAIVAIVIGITILKRVASCLLRSVVTLALVAILVYLYLAYLR